MPPVWPPMLLLSGLVLRCHAVPTISHCPTFAEERSVAGRLRLKRSAHVKAPFIGKPLQVHVGFYAESISNFLLSEMSFDMDIYLHMSWFDARLAHNGSDLVTVNGEEARRRIWTPDIYFANAKSARFQHVTVPNFVFWIDPEGNVSYSVRTTMTVACNLDLRHYPMDTQQCNLKINSFANDNSVMNVSWFDLAAIVLNPSIQLPEFQVVGVRPDYCFGRFVIAQTANAYRFADYSCLVGRIYLKRAIGYHMVQSYIPTGLIVIISWVSFWIDCNAVPARVSLSFTTLLTLSTMGAGLRYALPPVAYAKAIDYWYGMCMLFVFGALLEFAFVNSLMRRAVLRREKQLRRCASANNSAPSHTDDERPASAPVDAAMRVDQLCRLLFPLSFLLFNIAYWSIFLGRSDGDLSE